MFSKATTLSPRAMPMPIGYRQPTTTDHEAHAHSPQGKIRRPLASYNEIRAQTATYPAQQTPMHNAAGHRTFATGWPCPSTMQSTSATQHLNLGVGNDPFMGPSLCAVQPWQDRAQSGSWDAAMADYASSRRRASTDMSGLIYPKRNFIQHPNVSNTDDVTKTLCPQRERELLEGLSPPKQGSNGLEPPFNTPVGTMTPTQTILPPTTQVRHVTLGSEASQRFVKENLQAPTGFSNTLAWHDVSRSNLGARHDSVSSVNSFSLMANRISGSDTSSVPTAWSTFVDDVDNSSPKDTTVREQSARPRSSSYLSKRKCSGSLQRPRKNSRQATPEEASPTASPVKHLLTSVENDDASPLGAGGVSLVAH